AAAGDLVDRARPAEQHAIDLGLPVAEPGAGASADIATLVAVRAVVLRTVLEVEWPVRTVLTAGVLVPEDVEGTDHDAGRAPGAQPRGDDLVEEVAPLRFRLPAHRFRV